MRACCRLVRATRPVPNGYLERQKFLDACVRSQTWNSMDYSFSSIRKGDRFSTPCWVTR